MVIKKNSQNNNDFNDDELDSAINEQQTGMIQASNINILSVVTRSRSTSSPLKGNF
jgi:hypothetical protein